MSKLSVNDFDGILVFVNNGVRELLNNQIVVQGDLTDEQFEREQEITKKLVAIRELVNEIYAK